MSRADIEERRTRKRFGYFADLRSASVDLRILAEDRVGVVSAIESEARDLVPSRSVTRIVLRHDEGEPPRSQILAETTTPSSSDPSAVEFDLVIASKLVEHVHDIKETLQWIGSQLTPDGRLAIVTFNRIAQPLVGLLTKLRLRESPKTENWVPANEIHNFLEQVGFEVVQTTPRVLLPVRIPIISSFLNRWVAPLPLIRALALTTITVARRQPTEPRSSDPCSVSVIVAARNEAGNIEELLNRIPAMGDTMEVVVVEGGSTDGTWETLVEEANGRCVGGARPNVIALKQPGIGKADAIRYGMQHATGDVFIILDADLSVPPEELPQFVGLLTSGVCEFANGSRLVYAMDERAMRFLNLVGNRLFGALFSYLLEQPIRDTLCGTKALWRTDYERIRRNRDFFGDFDPFGDFDLLFGAARLGLRIRDVPIHYKERTYGRTNISRFSHGALLLRMSWIAARRIKFVPNRAGQSR